MSAFRDDWERKAHDIICIVKYGGYGGSVRNDELRKVADILRGHSIDPPRAPRLPVPVIPKLQHTLAMPALGVATDITSTDKAVKFTIPDFKAITIPLIVP